MRRESRAKSQEPRVKSQEPRQENVAVLIARSSLEKERAPDIVIGEQQPCYYPN